MADMLGSKAWQRSKKCKRVNCCTRPRRSKAAMRTYEATTWHDDAFQEDAPEVPEWITRYIEFAERRYGVAPARDFDCDHGCNGDCRTGGGSERCIMTCHDGMPDQ